MIDEFKDEFPPHLHPFLFVASNDCQARAFSSAAQGHC